QDTSLVWSALKELLGHENAVVREGAVYGLSSHLERSVDARTFLRDLENTDPSPGVVSAIRDVLFLAG
ncbi:MAG: hypothetical protein ACKVPX_02435, partial [Myxococcaceae bacterium]